LKDPALISEKEFNDKRFYTTDRLKRMQNAKPAKNFLNNTNIAL
jgi:hypothetical protein